MKKNGATLSRIKQADHRLLASLADVFAISRGGKSYVIQPSTLARTAYDDFSAAVGSDDPAEVVVVACHPMADGFTTRNIVGVGHARLKAPWASAIHPKLDILSVSVLPEFRSQKIGEAIVSNLEKHALPMLGTRRQAIERAIVSEDSPAALQLFAGRGFLPIRHLPKAQVMARVVEPAALVGL